MKQWYTARELVNVAGMPATEQGIRAKATREGFHWRYRAGQGGGKEYQLQTLPKATQTALHFQSNVPQGPCCPLGGDLVAQEKKDIQLTALKGWQRDIFHARTALYREYQRLKELHGTNKAVDIMVTKAKTKTLPPQLQELVPRANARKGSNRTLSRSMIMGWQRTVNRSGIEGLAPATIEKNTIPAWVPYFMKCYQLPTNPSIPQAMEAMAKVMPETIPMPSYNQVNRFNNKRSRLEREKGRKTGSSFMALKGYRKRDTSEFRPLAIGSCDGHSFKAKVAHPFHGRPFKPEVCAVIDIATRLAVGWSAGLAESAMTVADAVRHAATLSDTKPYGGIFGILYTDGGSGNTADVNADECTGLFARIGTELRTGIAGNAQGRGMIERLNSSMWIPAAKQLATFVGKDMDTLTKRNMYLLMEKDIKHTGTCKQLLSWPQFLAFGQETIDAYNRRPHSALPKLNDPDTGRKRHMTPLECWAWHMANGWNQADCQLSNEEIELLWRPREQRTVIRSSVSLNGNSYFNKHLAHIEGTKVHVAYDIHDASKVQIWNTEEQLVCYAFFEKNRESYFPVAEVERAAENRAKRRRKIKELQIQEIDEERRGVIEVQAMNRADIIEMMPPEPVPVQQQIDRERLTIDLEQPAALEIPNDDRGKYRLWQDLEGKLQAGEAIDENELRFFEAYRKTPSWNAFHGMEEQLGMHALQ